MYHSSRRRGLPTFDPMDVRQPNSTESVPPAVRIGGGVVVALSLLVLACGALTRHVPSILVGAGGIAFGCVGLFVGKMPYANRGKVVWLAIIGLGLITVAAGAMIQTPIQILMGINFVMPGTIGFFMMPDDAKPEPRTVIALCVAFPAMLILSAYSQLLAGIALVAFCAFQSWFFYTTARAARSADQAA